MVDFQETYARLNKEKDYEDQLIIDLSHFLIKNLDKVKGVKEEEKHIIKRKLNHIIAESTKHSYQFAMLIQMVLEKGEHEY